MIAYPEFHSEQQHLNDVPGVEDSAPFRAWLKQVDDLLWGDEGQSCVADYPAATPWRAWFDQGRTPREAVQLSYQIGWGG